MSLTFTPVSDDEGWIDVTVRTMGEEQRSPVRLLDAGAPRSEEVLPVCAWCRRIRLEGEEWVEIEDAAGRFDLFGSDPLPRISHGICPDCEKRVESAGKGEVA